MKKRAIALLLLLSLLTLPVLAEDGADPAPAQTLEEQFAALVAETVPSYSTVALGYKNTVTGEEHYYNPDAYIVGASLYKLPLNMIYAERISKGELSFDDKFDGEAYRDIQSASLTYSSNPPSVTLLMDAGDWRGMREKAAEYLGEDPSDEEYLRRTNRFSVREMVHCADLLQREQERFPGVLDALLLSAPGKFLKVGDPPYEIAQKYGNLNDGYTFFHAAGVIYCEQPVAVCIMTQGFTDSNALFSRFVELVASYTARTAAEAEAQRLQEEENARLEAERQKKLEEEAAVRAAAEAAAQEAQPSPAVEEPSPERRSLLPLLLIAAALLCILLLSRSRRSLAFLSLLFALLLVLLSLNADSDSALASSAASVGSRVSSLAEQVRARELQDLTEISLHFTIPESAVAGPVPDPKGYGAAADYGQFESVIQANRSLLGEDELLIKPETKLFPGSVIRYYADETIFVCVWQEAFTNALGQSITGTFAEVKLADGSQFRRKLGDDHYGSSIQKFPTEFAAECNAVLAMNADFYRFQNTGIHVYDRTVYAWDGETTDSCFFTDSGDLLFVPMGTLRGREAVEEYVRENDVRFGVSFGPIMIEDGVNVAPDYYWMGQSRDNYPRCALCQQGKLHYAAATFHVGASVQEATQWLTEKGVKRAYAMDGGQSAVIILGGELCNPMDQYSGSQRTMSDILYFCTALPEKESGA